MDLVNLPKVYRLIAPEFFQDPSRWPEETRASCHACPMSPQPDDPSPPVRRVFPQKHRCCTYSPSLTNWQAGRILRGGGVGAERLLARMDDPDGVTRYGVTADLFGERVYTRGDMNSFGAMDLRCPYWVDGALSCSIWENRNAVCRTWFCKSVDGRRGQQIWDATREMLYGLELATCDWLSETDTHPPHAIALARVDDEELPTLDDRMDEIRAQYDKQRWVDWFVACADRLDAVTDAEADAMRERAEVRGNLIRLRTAIANRKAPMPDVPLVSLVHWVHLGDRVSLMPFSLFDPMDAPPWIFTLLSKLDGKTPWRDAVAAAEAEVGEEVDPDFLPRLWRAGGLTWPDPRDADLGPGIHVRHLPVPRP